VFSTPTVGINSNGLIDVFVVAADHTMNVNRETSGVSDDIWYGFESLVGGPSRISSLHGVKNFRTRY